MKRNWRSYLKPKEREELAAVESRIKRLADDLSALRARRNRLQNRATARAKNREFKKRNMPRGRR